MKKRKQKLYGSQQIKKHKAWRAFSLYVRSATRNCYCCHRPVEPKKAHASHYHAGSICGKTLFIDERNVKKSCAACNLFLHGNLPQFALSLKAEYGPNILEELDAIRLAEKNAGIICRFTADELEAIYVRYKQKLENLCQ